MAFAYALDGVGILEITMKIDAASAKDFSQTDIDANLTACVVSDSNEVGMGSAGDKLFGKVTAVGRELQSGTTIPVDGTVQVRGGARFLINGTAPTVGQMVEVDGAGKVRVASADADIAAGGHLMRGQCVEVNAGGTECVIWLG